MGSRISKLQRPASTRIVSSTGCLRNQHFFITADHLLVEMTPPGFQLTGAIAEGHVEVHMLGGESEYVVLAESGVYQADLQRIVLNGWKGTRENGADYPPTAFRREVLLPTDGTFFHVASDESRDADSASKKSELQAA